MENDLYEVIVIGAGMSGIGASKKLTEKGIPHLMLQSRDRIGGRIISEQFDGIRIDLGASFVHCPDRNNLIHEFIQANKFQTIPASYNAETYYYENENILSQKHLNKAWTLYEQLNSFVEQECKKMIQDKSVEEIFLEFMKARPGMEEHVRNTFRWIVEVFSNVEGGELKDLSMRGYNEDQTESANDYLPANGYEFILKKIFESCKPELKLSHKVLKIDYNGDIVNVITDKGDFRGRRVIASFPLGVLQQKKVEFTPSLPVNYGEKIFKMGSGVANKIFISFEKPFWGHKKGWLNFVTKTKKNMYPIALILPEKTRYILCFFVSANNSIELSQWTDEKVQLDLLTFLEKFIKQEVKVRAFKMTRWHLDEHSLGSYSFIGVGHDQTQFSQIMSKPIDNKIWLVGEYTHSEMNACVHAAYESGIRAAQSLLRLLEKDQQAK